MGRILVVVDNSDALDLVREALLEKDRHSNGVCPGSEVLEAKIKVICQKEVTWDRVSKLQTDKSTKILLKHKEVVLRRPPSFRP